MSPIDNKPISVGIRLAAMLLDHIFMTIILLLFFLPGMLLGFSGAFTVSHEQSDTGFMTGPFLYVGVFGLALYFCKDIINGRSIAKRILKLQVVDNKTGQAASPMQTLIRNISGIVWIVEVIVVMTNTSRRLGDRIAGTKLVPYDPALAGGKVNLAKLALPVAGSYLFILLFVQLMPSQSLAKTSYSESSYNSTESKELEKLITDNLGEYLTPDVRIYDTVNNERIKYVSLIMRLKENYIAESDSYNQLHSETENLIYSRLPKETFTGRVKYVYKGRGQFQSTSTTIGSASSDPGQ